MPRHAFVFNANRLQTWCITSLSFNLARLIGFLLFSYLEEAYINPSPFVINIEFLEATIFGRIFCKFLFLYIKSFILGFAFISFLSSLSSFSLLSFTFPAAKHTS